MVYVWVRLRSETIQFWKSFSSLLISDFVLKLFCQAFMVLIETKKWSFPNYKFAQSYHNVIGRLREVSQGSPLHV